MSRVSTEFPPIQTIHTYVTSQPAADVTSRHQPHYRRSPRFQLNLTDLETTTAASKLDLNLKTGLEGSDLLRNLYQSPRHSDHSRDLDL